MRQTALFRVFFVFIVLTVLSGCAGLDKTVNVEEYKADCECLVYPGEMVWKDVEDALGEPDQFPLPSGERLSKNTRIYENKILIFYTEPKRIKIQGKIRFLEVVTKVEICTKK